MDMRAAMARLEAGIFETETLAKTLHMAGEDLGFDHFCLVHSNIQDLQVIAADHSLAAFEAYDAGGWARLTTELQPSICPREAGYTLITSWSRKPGV